MKLVRRSRKEQKILPDESFVSCLCCIPGAWTLFANDQWTRIFKNHDEGLDLIKEFRKELIISFSDPTSFVEKTSLWLDEAVWKNEFDYLIIVAPTSILNQVNKTLSPPVLARTIAEINWPAMMTSSYAENKEQKFFPSPCDQNQ